MYTRGVYTIGENTKIAKDVYFNDKELLFKLMNNAYSSDYSWDYAVENYIKFYDKILNEWIS